MSHSIRIAAVDLNGQFRGKRMAAGMHKKTVRMPFSALNADIMGNDIKDSPLVFESGDQDGVLMPTDRGDVPLPWVSKEAHLIPCTLHHEDASPFVGDPRHALAAVLGRFDARGWQVISACELEFYLMDANCDTQPAYNPQTGQRLAQPAVLSIRELDNFNRFFDEIFDGATQMGLDNLIITDEAGIGQFEITLTHGPALKAADDVILLKELIKGVARRHNMIATFMAKPFADQPGNGLHTHFSVVDGKGKNVFYDTKVLQAAVAGCLDAFTACTTFFAPFANSYDRFVKNAHAPTQATWGYDNRTVALRIPKGAASNTRIEHRAAGGDVNPYLLYAAIFGAALRGIEQALTPPAPINGNAYALDTGADTLCKNLSQAVQALEVDTLKDFMPAELLRNLAMTKRQEIRLMAQMETAQTLQILREAV